MASGFNGELEQVQTNTTGVIKSTLEVHYDGKLNGLHNFPFLEKRLGKEYNGDLKVAGDAKSKWMCVLPQNTGTGFVQGNHQAAALNQRTATNAFAT